MADPTTLLKKLESELSQLDVSPDNRETANNVARLADELGYCHLPDYVSFDRLMKDATRRIETALSKHPTDYVLLNNLGVLYCNRGLYAKSLKCFRKALKETSADSNVHENVRIAQIYLGRKKLHQACVETKPGEETLLAYFDAQAM